MKVERFTIKDWEKEQIGLIISENQDWVLVKDIPVDYVVDGYRIYKKVFIENRCSGAVEQKIEQVLRLKQISVIEPKDFVFSDTIGLLKWVEKNYDIIEFQDDIDDELFYGKINTIDGDDLMIDFIKADGLVEKKYDYQFNIPKIRVISFDTDYHWSIRLLWKDRN